MIRSVADGPTPAIHSATWRVAYLVNQYPKVSHSFIRREILALERQGEPIERIALRGWQGDLVDAQDVAERSKTRYVLKGGLLRLLVVALSTFLRGPGVFLTALAFALRLSRRADRSWPYHLAYFAEACQVLRWVRERGVTHLHAHFGTNSSEVAMLVRALGGPPYSFTVHGPEEFDKPEFLGLGEKIRRAAFAVAVSSYGRSQLYRWVGHEHWEKIKVIHCGLESSFHAGHGGNPLAANRLVCVGRLCEQKGQLMLIQAAARLARREIAFELVLVGDGEMRSEIEALVAALGIAAQVRITGWISSEQVRAEILAARALVLPSFAEGLPVVIMEAMALRRPVITTYVAGIPELVRPGEAGWLIPAGDLDQLVLAMEQCLAAPSDVLARMADAALRRVLERHDIDAEAAKLAALFRQHAAAGKV